MSEDWKGEGIIRNVKRANYQGRNATRRVTARECRKCNAPLSNNDPQRVICHACTKPQMHEINRRNKRPMRWAAKNK